MEDERADTGIHGERKRDEERNLLAEYHAEDTGEAVFPLFTQHAFGWSALPNGYLFAYAGMAMVMMRGSVAGRLVKRWGERHLLIAGLVLLAAGLAGVAWSANLALVLIALGIVSAGDGIVMPMVSTLLSFASPPRRRAKRRALHKESRGWEEQ